jgi:enoyl-CoA hydratase
VVEVELQADGVARLRLARPPVNALDRELVDAIASAVATAVQDGARALVLTGAGRCFSAGIDTKVVPSYDAAQRRAAIDAIDAMVATVCSAALPVIAALNGHAFGGGLVIALACDRRLLARGEHKLALNEVAAGVPFPAGPLSVVNADLDPSVVRDLCLSGRTIDPQEALALRVVDELVEPERLLSRAGELALELAAFPAYATVKAQVRGPLIAELQGIVAASAAAGAQPERQPPEA